MMKLRLVLLLFALCLFAVTITWVVFAESTGWETVGEGVDYREYQLPDPNNVYVARMDRSNPNVTIETSIAQGKLVSGLETVSSQASRYDGALNNWGQASIPHESGAWGTRNDVVVAINGTFIYKDTLEPWEGQVHSGWYASRFKDVESRNTFLWKFDREAVIGDCMWHPDSKQLVKFLKNGESQPIDGINIPRENNSLILYTPQYDHDTNTNEFGVEVLVEMTSPTIIMNPEYVTGYVREIRYSEGSTLIPFDHIVLSAQGAAADQLLDNVELEDQIGISQRIRNCANLPDVDWSKTFAGMVSNDYYFLKEGEYQHNSETGANVCNPRTAVAFNDDYVFFIVVDGRHKDVSIGMNMEELANFAKDELGATDGLSLDGGGSSTMVVNGEVMNFPSDGVPKTEATDTTDGLDETKLMIMREKALSRQRSSGDFTIYLPILQKQYSPPPPLPIVERAVPNGLMFVFVLPKEQSTADFKPGDEVVINTYGYANLRLGPGTNYHVIDSLPGGSEGEILSHMNGLNGVRAKGYYWWKVQFGDLEGWMAEFLLAHK